MRLEAATVLPRAPALPTSFRYISVVPQPLEAVGLEVETCKGTRPATGR